MRAGERRVDEGRDGKDGKINEYFHSLVCLDTSQQVLDSRECAYITVRERDLYDDGLRVDTFGYHGGI